MMEVGLYDRNARLLLDFFRRNDTRIGLEDRILGAERKDLEPAIDQARHAQIIQATCRWSDVGGKDALMAINAFQPSEAKRF